MISLLGADNVTIECLPESNLPNALANMGHDLKPEPDGERILPVAVSQKMTRNVDGTLGSLTGGSTEAVTWSSPRPASSGRADGASTFLESMFGWRPPRRLGQIKKISTQDVLVSAFAWQPAIKPKFSRLSPHRVVR